MTSIGSLFWILEYLLFNKFEISMQMFEGHTVDRHVILIRVINGNTSGNDDQVFGN